MGTVCPAWTVRNTRAADIATNGVREIKTRGKADSPAADPNTGEAEAERRGMLRAAEIAEAWKDGGGFARDQMLTGLARAIRAEAAKGGHARAAAQPSKDEQ